VTDSGPASKKYSPLMASLIRKAPNLLADVAIYRVTKSK